MDQRPQTWIIVLGIAGVGSVAGLLTYPFAKAIWMFIDHILHPLED